jgi:hypothetical protein
MTHRRCVFFSAIVFAVAAFIGASCAVAQQPSGVSQALANLSDQPGTHVSFTFDRSMLEFAGRFIDNGTPEGRRAVAALTSITVDTYHYPRPTFYTPEVMASIINTYHAAGWKHLVDANATPATSASPRDPITDLWIHFRGGEIDDVTVLVRGPRTMNVIQISGALRPLDLVHLSGHFGIPHVDPNAVMVPAPDGR